MSVNCNLLFVFSIFAFLLGANATNESTTEVTTTTTPTVTSTTTPTTSTAPGSGAVTTMIPSSTLAAEEQATLDVVFSDFIQGEASSYSRALAVVVNISTRRVSFVKHGDRVGYVFGSSQIVRAHILIRTFDDMSESSSTDARDLLVGLIASTDGVHKDLQRYGVTNAYAVSEDPRLYTFKVYTTYDLLYTFVYVVVAVLYASFLGFVAFKFIHQCVAEGEDKKDKKKESKRLEAKTNPNASNGPKVQKAETFDRSDVDKERLAGMNAAAARVERRLRLLAEEEHRQQQSMNLKAQISPEIDSFLNMTSLPPPTDPTTDPFYRSRGGRPPLAPAHSPDRTAIIDMDEL